MKTLVQVSEVEGEGLLAYLGQPITLFCANYIYTGTLVGVNDTCVKLDDAKIVYDTGSFTTKGWSDAQALSWKYHYIQCSAIESFGGIK